MNLRNPHLSLPLACSAPTVRFMASRCGRQRGAGLGEGAGRCGAGERRGRALQEGVIPGGEGALHRLGMGCAVRTVYMGQQKGNANWAACEVTSGGWPGAQRCRRAG